MPRLVKALSDARKVGRRRFRQVLRVRMPVTNEVEALFVEATYFRSLALLMRLEPESGPKVSTRGGGCDLSVCQLLGNERIVVLLLLAATLDVGDADQ
jgi:maleate cis-trans isomerase